MNVAFHSEADSFCSVGFSRHEMLCVSAEANTTGCVCRSRLRKTVSLAAKVRATLDVTDGSDSPDLSCGAATWRSQWRKPLESESQAQPRQGRRGTDDAVEAPIFRWQLSQGHLAPPMSPLTGAETTSLSCVQRRGPSRAFAGCVFQSILAPIILLSIAFATLNPAIGSEIQFTPDIIFAEPAGETLRLNLARPADDTDGPYPVVVCIHGGGFSGGTRTDYDDLCRRFAERGYVAVTIDYRLSPKHKWPVHIHDCKAAIRWLRAHASHYAIDPAKIAAMGSSAGGHLAQFLAVTNDVREFDGDHTHLDQSSRITCVAAWSQASDFTREYGVWKGAAEAFRGFLGAELTAETRRTHVRASPLFWVTPNAAPTLIIHGTKDEEVLFLQSVWIYEKLRSAEVDVELIPIEGGGHGLAGPHQEQAEQAMFRFFDRQFDVKQRGTEGATAK